VGTQPAHPSQILDSLCRAGEGDTNKKLTSKVHQIVSKEIAAYYARVAKSKGVENPLPGSITFAHRFGSACNLNIHFHLIALEGVYAQPHSEDAIP
jgi:hypothetical protein